MNYNLVQRELLALGADLTEMGEGIIRRPKAPGSMVPLAPRPVMSVEDVKGELSCILQRLEALAHYIKGDN